MKLHSSTIRPSQNGVTQHRLVAFKNGDAYEGEWFESSEGGTQHGYGTYEYRNRGHLGCSLYKGQWHKGLKHGHGVLLYQNGGIYVGQWMESQKHGLGIMLGNTQSQTAQCMPTYSYEGEWRQDQMNGLGVKETSDCSFFGTFCNGRCCPPGMRVSVTGCEVLEESASWRPLLESVEARVAHHPANETKTASYPETLASPMMWGEDELAAFLGCIGCNQAVVERVITQKLRGVDHFFQMLDARLHDDFGFTSVMQRHIARKAFRRFLEIDRLPHNVPDRGLNDVADDATLREFLIPFDELRVECEKAQGRFGIVFQGLVKTVATRRQLEAGRAYKVAVKAMKVKGARSRRLYELHKECQVMASLRHRNVCNLVGICAKSSVPGSTRYILTELMDCSLFDIIHRPQKTSWAGDFTLICVMGLAEGMSVGMAYMHEKCLVHADLKSSNIVIDHTSSKELVPKICDFGHAVVRARPAPHRCGTPQWAAPEALRNEAIGPKSDVFSWGVMLWEMLSRTLPHKHLTSAQVVGTVGWSASWPNMKLLPALPPDLEDLLLRCLQHASCKRPSAKDMRPRLRRINRSARREAKGMLVGFLGGGV